MRRPGEDVGVGPLVSSKPCVCRILSRILFCLRDCRAVLDDGQAGLREIFGLEVGKSFDDGAGVGEGAAVAGVEVGFRRQFSASRMSWASSSTCQYSTWENVHLRHGNAVEQGAGRDERAVEGEVVAGAHPEVAVGLVLGEGVGGNADRPDVFGRRVARDFDAAKTDPADRAQRAGGGDDEVAEAQVLDRDLAALRGDARSPLEAGDVAAILDFEPCAGAAGSGCAEQVASGIDDQRIDGA